MVSRNDATKSPAEVVRAVIDNATRLIMGDNTDRVADLYAEPTYVLHPLQPDIPPLITHDDFRRHGAALLERMGRPDSHRAVDIVVHATIDPELVVTEFRYETTLNGVIMVTPCVWVTRVREGRVVEARDYNGEPRPSGPTPGTR